MKIKFYEVGGSVRDRMLGLKPKDFDYAVEAPSFDELHSYIEGTHDSIFLVKEEFLTIELGKTKRSLIMLCVEKMALILILDIQILLSLARSLMI